MEKSTWTLEDVRRALDAQDRRLAAAHEAASERDPKVRLTPTDRERLEVAYLPRHMAAHGSGPVGGAIPC